MSLLDQDYSAIQWQATTEPQQACLSQRMPIEFFSMTSHALAQEQHQVEAHMHICLKVLPGFQGMVTASPSEPILSEAASKFMPENNFNSLKPLQPVTSGFSV